MKTTGFHITVKGILAGLGLLAAVSGCGPNSGGKFSGAFPAISASGEQNLVTYTIVLAQFPQPDGLTLAQQVREMAQQLYRFGDIWLQSDAQWISVHYGHFDQRIGADAMERELMRVQQLYPQLGLGPYQFCFVKELAQPDPPAPVQWYLLNNACFYSLEVASYFNDPEQGYYNRKADAVQAVKNLREQDQSAYLVHGRFESRIYVGCFPSSAVQLRIQNNVTIRELSPALRELRNQYVFHENGMKIIDIGRDAKGKEIRVPRRPRIIQVNSLAMGIPF